MDKKRDPRKKKKKEAGPFAAGALRLLRPLERLAIATAVGTLGRFSPRMRMRVSRAMGLFGARLMPFRKGVVVEQLRMAFPEYSDAKISSLLPEIYSHLIAFGLEMLAMARITREEIVANIEPAWEEMGPVPGWQRDKQGFVLVTSHMGNWEWAGAYISVMGLQLGGAAKPMHDPVGEDFIQRVRARYGVHPSSTRQTANQVMSHLIRTVKKGGVAALPADQDARHAGIFIDFLGHTASTFAGPAWLSYKLNVPILPVWGFRTPEGKLRYKPDEPIWPDAQAEMESEIRRLTECHVRSLERAVRAAPAQYMWFHRRWKTRPKRNLKAADS